MSPPSALIAFLPLQRWGRRVSGRRIGVLAARQHGVLTRGQARAAGLTAHAITHRRRSGRWVDLHRGVYAVAGAPPTAHQRTMAAALSLGEVAVVASVSAAWLHGLVEKPTESIYVLMPRGQHRRARPGFVIAEADLTRADVQRVSSIPITRVDRTLVDLAGHMSSTRLETALDTAVVHGLTTIGKVSAYIAERGLRHKRGARTLGKLLHDRSVGVHDSEFERVFLRKLRASRIPEPTRQYRIGTRRVDFAFPSERIVVELDGLRHHFTAAAFRNDRRRQNELVLAGWTPFRFTWDDVTMTWPTVVDTLRKALRLADS